MKVLLLLSSFILASATSKLSKEAFEDNVGEEEDRASKTRRVLFIGNSFTFYHEMPQMVRDLAEAAGHTMYWQMQVKGGRNLSDHWSADSRARDKIRNGSGSSGKDWDVVVINEKSTYPAYKDSTVCRKMYPYAEKFTEYIRKYNPDAKIQWYMTWGWKNGNDKWCEKYDWFCTYEDMQERIRETYMTMACSLKPSRVAPVGDAFAQYKKNYGEEEWMKLFMKAEDDHHSSVKGSYLAACVHYSMIFGEPCSGNSFRKSWTSQKNGKKYKLSDESAEKLQKTADEIVGSKDQRMNFVFHSSNDSCEISPCLRAG